jgi:hypothetical protein
MDGVVKAVSIYRSIDRIPNNNAGLVEVQAMANRRIYKLRAEPFKELDSWLESYRHIWNERFDRLDDYLQDLQSKEVNHDDKQ